jgi:hypothetical protein
MDIDSILKGEKDLFDAYPYLGPVLSATVTGGVSFIAGIRHHQRQIDKEAAKEHSGDLKELVVKPLLQALEASSSKDHINIFSLEEARKQGRLSGSITAFSMILLIIITLTSKNYGPAL